LFHVIIFNLTHVHDASIHRKQKKAFPDQACENCYYIICMMSLMVMITITMMKMKKKEWTYIFL